MTATLPALCGAFLLSMYFRSYFGIVGPTIAHELALSPQDFGWLASAFFASFSILQIPVGIAFDRWGVRWPMALMMCVGAAGSLLVALASGFSSALIGQTLIGIGCAPIFMGVLYFLGRTHTPEAAGRLAAVVGAVGSAGALMSASPLSWFTSTFGWRAACLAGAAAIFASAIAIASVLGSTPPARQENAGVSERASLSALLYLAPLCFTLSIGSTFRNAWAAPYMTASFGDGVDVGTTMTVISMVGIFTSFLLPVVLLRMSATNIVTATYLVGVICSVVLAAAPGASVLAACVGLSLLYAMGNVHPLVMTEAQTRIPERLRGIGLGALNTLAFLGVSAASSAFGQLVGLSLPTDTSYRLIFALTAAAIASALAVYLKCRSNFATTATETPSAARATARLD